MASMPQEYWIIGAIALLAAAITLWLVMRSRRRSDAPSLPKAPTAPLQPVKPEIVAAEPAQFAAAEPVAPSPPAAEAAPVITPAVGAHDNLALIKGLGPKLVTILAGLGVTRFDQIAAWTDADVAAIDPQLGPFAGRPARDNWVDQAGYLARGDKAGFEAKYGALGGEL
jgi:predicted flap endonuclease-1-like 5' DNA nuclease